MTKKDYVEIAKILKRHREYEGEGELSFNLLVLDFEVMLSKDSRNFNRDMFTRAVYKTERKTK